MTLILLLGIACLAGAAYLVAEVITLPSRERVLSFRRAATYGKRPTSRPAAPSGGRSASARLAPMTEQLACVGLEAEPEGEPRGDRS